MSVGRQDKIEPSSTRGTQVTEVATLFPSATVPSSSYVRTKAIMRSHGNEANIRIWFTQVTASRKLSVVVCEGDTDPAPNGLPADTTVVGGVQSLLDTSAARLKKNAFTIDETTTDDQGNQGFYPYDVRLRAPYTWLALKLDGVGAAGDVAKVEIAEVLTQ